MSIEQEPIRVAQVTGKAGYGGVDSTIMSYYRHIDRSRVQFDFFMDGLEKSPIDDEITSLGGKIYKLPAYASSMRANLRSFHEILAENPYKIIHSHMNTLSVFWLREAKRAGIPIRIAHNHSTAHWSEGVRTLLKYMLRPFSKTFATHYFACSEHAGRWLFGNKAFDTGKVTVIPNAIDTGKYRFNPDTRERVRKELNLDGKFVIGHVGRFVHSKNHRFLIKVFAEVHKQNTNVVLLLVGDGELRQEIEQIVARLGLQNAVLFLGSRRDVHELYQAMDVFALPSRYEGFGIVAIEAQCAGLPCIMSDRVTGEAVLCDGCTQVELDVDRWAQAIIATAGASRADRSGGIAEKGYDITDAVKRLKDFYIT